MCPAPLLLSALLAAEPSAAVRFRIVELAAAGAEAPAAASIFLEDVDGRPVRVSDLAKAGEGPVTSCPWFDDHVSCDGSADLRLPPGSWRWAVERGPEYRQARGRLDLAPGSERTETVRLERWIDLSRRGWWSGELHVHRPIEHLDTLLRAADLHVLPALTVWNRNSLWDSRPLPEELLVEVEPTRVWHALAAEDERRGGALMYFNLTRPLDLHKDRPEFPPPVVHLGEAAAQPGVHVDIEKPFWWDVPTWVATGRAHTIGVANNHMCRRGMLENEAWGRPRDEARLPPPRGNGLWSQELWYRLLDCGFRIVPSAGSASGVLPNPVGYNRVYVQLEGPFEPEAWWRGLAAGRTFATNGPILLVEANGRPPGETFRGPAGEPFRVSLDVLVDGEDPIEAVEVVRDGDVVERLPGKDAAGRWLRPTVLSFERPGWFLVRAIADVPETFRFATTAPFWVEVGEATRTVDRKAVEDVLGWIDERIRALEASPDLGDPAERQAVLTPHRNARKVFEARLAEADGGP